MKIKRHEYLLSIIIFFYSSLPDNGSRVSLLRNVHIIYKDRYTLMAVGDGIAGGNRLVFIAVNINRYSRGSRYLPSNHSASRYDIIAVRSQSG